LPGPPQGHPRREAAGRGDGRPLPRGDGLDHASPVSLRGQGGRVRGRDVRGDRVLPAPSRLHHVHARRGGVLRGVPARDRARDRDVRADGPVTERSLQAYYPELARIGAEARIESGEVLWREADPADTVPLVLDGTLEVVYRSPDSEEEVVLRTLEGGAVVGELAGADGRARSATVRARTPCRILKIPASDFRLLLRQRPDILEELYWLQVERVRSL